MLPVLKHTPATIEAINLTLAAGAKATAAPQKTLPAGKFICGVQPVVMMGSIPQAAGVYVRVTENLNGIAGTGDTCRVLWQGYVRGEKATSSIPNTQIRDGNTVIAEAWCLAAFDTVKLNVHLCLSDQPDGGTYIHDEAPGSGEGEPRTITISAPAAGANPAQQTVPAFTEQRIEAVTADFTPDANAASRQLRLKRDDGANAYSEEAAPVTLAANSGAATMRSFIGAGIFTTNPTGLFSFPLWTGVMKALHRWQVIATSIQAGDQFANVRAFVREWAVPQ